MMRLLAATVLPLLALAATTSAAVVEATIATAPASRRPWVGFGYNQYPQDRDAAGNDRPWTADHWTLTTTRMAAIAPALVRINCYRDWFNADAGGRPLPVGQYRFDNPAMASFERVLRWYQEHSIPVMTGLWDSGHAGEKEDRSFDISAGPGSFAELQGDLLNELIRVQHLSCVRWYTPVNEPGGSGISRPDWSIMIRNASKAIAARGLPTNMLVGADMWDDWTPYAAQTNSNVISGYEHHKYLNDPESWLAGGGLRRYLSQWLDRVDRADPSIDKPVFLSECGATDPNTIDYWWKHATAGMDTPRDPQFALGSLDWGIQTAASGEGGALAWALDGFDRMKDPGMWNIAGANGGVALRPWFYTWSLLCRGFPAGSAVHSISGVRGVAARTLDGRWSIAIVNRTAAPESIDLPLPPGAAVDFDLFVYSTRTAADGAALSLPSTPLKANASRHLTTTISSESGIVAIGRSPSVVNSP